MFSFMAGTNPYDANVDKATDEAQTSENWDLLMTICDKVDSDGETGARNVVQSLQRRFAHRSANVQLFSLTLADALVSNCKAPLHREVASAAFMETIKRLATDRTSHDKVKKRAFLLLQKWSGEFEQDERLGLVDEAYQALVAKGIRYDEDQPQAPATRIDENEIRRKEEEDIQRAIRESEEEAKRAQTRYGAGYTPSAVITNPSTSTSYAPPRLDGYAPNLDKPTPQPPTSSAPAVAQAPLPAPSATPPTRIEPAQPPRQSILRARALYDFNPDPNEPNELPLRKGDIVRVLDKVYDEWWRGESKGRVGIFPCNWIEVLPELSEQQLLAEARAEAAVFSQIERVDRLLDLLRKADATPNPAATISDDDEVTELYQQCLSLRPKVVKLIDKYASRREELLDINTKFVEAKRGYEAMLEDSWSQHNAAQQAFATQPAAGYYYPQQQQQQAYQGPLSSSQGSGPHPAYSQDPSLQQRPATAQQTAPHTQQPHYAQPVHPVQQPQYAQPAPTVQQPQYAQPPAAAQQSSRIAAGAPISVSSPPLDAGQQQQAPPAQMQALPNPYETPWPAPVAPPGAQPYQHAQPYHPQAADGRQSAAAPETRPYAYVQPADINQHFQAVAHPQGQAMSAQ